MPDQYQILQSFHPNSTQHIVRVSSSLERANKRAADYFINEATSGWTAEDQAGQRKIDFAQEVYDVLPALKVGEGFWAKERNCKIDDEEGTFLVWVEKKAAVERDW